MDSIEQNLADTGLTLPTPSTASPLYVPALLSGNLIYTSGQLPLANGVLVAPGGIGRVGDACLEAASEASRIALLNALAAICTVSGSLEAITQVVRLTLYVSSEPDFTGQHLVANGASSLLLDIFKERGRHVRSAVGVASLPLNASLELELIVAYNPSCSRSN
ncbi:MAG: LysR family transcriptional regulator [Pelodictyon luteolum]|jgi:enamine deaminase RidA (YjgF/YER057c/UK114 family)|uniref:LysR family transcriptional regulator n=1 Tax=Pelodictyon luteolum TaxID=1100 RepID=A0A165M2D0_PELLU|nr:RidA family protein [Pelodictyon luteolum]KZK74733.1 MAG: LysR family transcriptional regulator [Pelodictyon luteolum]